MKTIVRILLFAVTIALVSCHGPQEKNVSQNIKPPTEISYNAPEHMGTGDSSQFAQPKGNREYETTVEQYETKEEQNTPIGFPNWLLSLIVIAEGLVIIILFLKNRKYLKEIKDGIDNANKRIDKRKKEIFALGNPYSYGNENLPQKSTISDKDKQNRQFVSKVEQKDASATKSEKPDLRAHEHKVDNQDLLQVYVRHYKDDILEPVDKDSAFYEVNYPPDNKIGSFTFVGDSLTAIKNRSSEIDGVCDATGISSIAKSIKTTKWGRCERMSDGKWKILERAQITFEQ